MRLLLAALAMACVIVLYAVAAARSGVPPRSLAPYLQRRTAGHVGWLVAVGDRAANMLLWADRGAPQEPSPLDLRIGARIETSDAEVGSSAHVVAVSSVEQLVAAIDNAKAGDAITLEPGTYRLGTANIEAKHAGTNEAPIVVRARRAGTALLEIQSAEGFVVSEPYWGFEGLTIRGACKPQGNCEHAFHVVGKAAHFHARNNSIADFNAHFKINGEGGQFPDSGSIEANTLTNSAARETDSTVSTIDLVAANDWVVRGNFISDFVKAGGDLVSTGAYAKGGGQGNRFEQNIVLCENRLRGAAGSRVGLSLGGGGTGKQFCRDGRCITEQDGGVIESNLIAACSDDGVYINRSATSRVLHNTLTDTGGIEVRFAESSADLDANIVDGSIRSRDNGLLREGSNLTSSVTSLYFGRHAQRALFVDAAAFDFRWAGDAPRMAIASSAASSPRALDLCGASRPRVPTYGAFEDFAACTTHGIGPTR